MYATARSGLAGILSALVSVMLMAALSSPACADAKPFWENDEPAPSLSGHRHRATAGVAKAARHHHTAAAVEEDDRPARRPHRAKRVASLGGGDEPVHHHKSLSGGGVTWAASSGCLNGTLASIIHEVGSSYGPVTVNSTCRSPGHNAAVGGAHRSQHLTGDAVDFRVHGNISGAIAYLRNNGSIGGYKHYGGGLFHIDTGPHRTW